MDGWNLEYDPFLIGDGALAVSFREGRSVITVNFLYGNLFFL